SRRWTPTSRSRIRTSFAGGGITLSPTSTARRHPPTLPSAFRTDRGTCMTIMEAETRVPAAELTALVTDIFARCDMNGADAALLADSLVVADLTGVHSHGILRVPEYVSKLTVGGVNPRGRPFIARDSGACLIVDGDNSMGQIGASFAMEQ